MSAEQRRSARAMRHAVRLARRLMPLDGNLDDFIASIARHRGRPITLVQLDRRPSDDLSGLWLATESADYIIVDPTATPSRRALIVCHEIAHMLLGHRGDLTTSQLLATTAPDLNCALVARVLGRHAYGSADEQAAEEMATVVAAERSQREDTARLHLHTNSARLR